MNSQSGNDQSQLLAPEATERDLLASARAKIHKAKEHYSYQYEKIESDLEFESGKQWEDEVEEGRTASGRPVTTINVTRAYVDRVVNPLRMNPLRPMIRLKEAKKEELVNGLIGAITHKSGGGMAMISSFHQAVSTGIGYLVVDVVHDPMSRMREPTIKYRSVRRITSMYIDPWSTELDGSDARWAVEVDFVSQAEAQDKYPDMSFGERGFDSMTNLTSAPSHSIPSVIMWEMVDDPSFKGKGQPPRVCQVTHFLGDNVMSCTNYPVSTLMVIPIYGDRQFQKNLYWSGMVQRVKDIQRQINYFAANSLEQAALAPKAPFLVAEGQIDDYEDEWGTLNSRNHAYLTYKNVRSADGSIAPPPVRMDNRAQTDGLENSLQRAMGDLQRTTGIPDAMLMGSSQTGEAAAAITARLGAAEISTCHYVDNYSFSLQRLGYLTMELAGPVYSGMRRIALLGPDDKITSKIMDLSQEITPTDLLEISYDINGGPTQEMRRKDSVQALQQIMQVSPDTIPKLLVHYVKMLDLPDGDRIVRDINGEQDPDSTISPALQKAMGSAQQAIQVQQQHLDQCEQEIQQLKQGDQLKMQMEMTKFQHEMQLEKMRQEFELKKLQIIEGAKHERVDIQSNAKEKEIATKNEADINIELLKQNGENRRELLAIGATQQQADQDRHFNMAGKVLDHMHDLEHKSLDHKHTVVEKAIDMSVQGQISNNKPKMEIIGDGE